MTEDLSSGKGHRDENFPVASALIAPRHRSAVMAFYAVARLADDIADHPTATPDEKLVRLAAVESSLVGDARDVPAAVRLREVMAERGLPAQHILELLEAFRRDAVKARTTDWADLMDYCRYSAAPVGRYVLDVHGESRNSWPASDALCAALQVINHLQDCGEDYRSLDRVYIPLDALAAEGLEVTALGQDRASPELLRVVGGLARRTLGLLATSRTLSAQVRDGRLSLEIGAIQRLAESLARGLTRKDPLSDRVHHSPFEMFGMAGAGALQALSARFGLGEAGAGRHRAPR